jgi:hypothetical protein
MEGIWRDDDSGRWVILSSGKVCYEMANFSSSVGSHFKMVNQHKSVLVGFKI